MRQLHVTGVRVSALCQSGAHSYWPSCCIKTAWPPLLLLLQMLSFYCCRCPIAGEKKVEALLNLKSSHCQRQCYSHSSTEYYKWKLPSSHSFHLILLRTSISHLFHAPFLAEYSWLQFETWANLESCAYLKSHRYLGCKAANTISFQKSFRQKGKKSSKKLN